MLSEEARGNAVRAESAFTQVTVVPIGIFNTSGMNLKLLIWTTFAGDADAAVATFEIPANESIKIVPSVRRENRLGMRRYPVLGSIECAAYASVESTNAIGPSPRLIRAVRMPSTPCRASVGTCSGPGEDALPGAGCG